MDILQVREQKAIIEELEKDIEGKKEDLYILENFVEFKTKKDGNLYQNLTRNLGDNMKIEYSFISPSEINYIEVGGRINNHYYKNVRIYNDRDKVYNDEKIENLTDSEKIELIKKLIEDRKITLRNQIEQHTKELTTVAERLTRITELVNEFNEKLNNENLVTVKDKYLIEEYIKNSIKIKTR